VDSQQTLKLLGIIYRSLEIILTAPILVVEDDFANQQVATLYLKKLGHISEVAENGEIAVKLAQKQQYKIILMDCQMPVMDGFTASQLIRESEGLNQTTPIIALTANLVRGIKEECQAHGMNDILHKPIAVTEMEKILVKWCDKNP